MESKNNPQPVFRKASSFFRRLTLGRILLFGTAIFIFSSFYVYDQNSAEPLIQTSRCVKRCGKKDSQNLIPRIIHQSWKTDELPERFEKWSEGWKRIHPDHTYLFWTDKTNRELVEAEFPWFLETYDKLPKNIHRADAVRYCYMYKYGGVYADLDVDALKPMNELFPKLSARYSRLSEEDKRNFVYDIDPDNPETWKLSYSSAAKPSEKQPVDLVLPLMSNDTKFIHNVPNAWMASKPGHSFWVWVLHKIQNTLKDPKNANLVEELTGPVALYETAIEWQKQRKTIQGVESDTGKNIFGEFNERIWFAPPGVIFPYDWTKAHEDGSYCSGQSPTFDANECIKKVTTEDSYSITYWTHTWG